MRYSYSAATCKAIMVECRPSGYEPMGAVWGQGTGLQGQTYAIPTMQGGIGTIRPYIDQFIKFAQNDPERTFLVTEIGCGIAGFRPADIAPLFKNAINIPNIWLPQRFWEILQKEEVQDLI